MTTIVNLDLSNVQPWGSSAPVLPVGEKQKVVVESAELKASFKDPKNGQLVVTMRVLAGDNAGKVGTVIYHIFHEKQEARDIARQKASALWWVTAGRAQLGDAREIYNIPFYVDVVQQEGSRYTDISNYFDQHGNSPEKVAQGSRGQVAPTVATPSFATPPAATAAAPASAPAAFTPPAVAFDPNAAAPVAGFNAPAAGGAFPGAVPAPSYSAPAAAPAAPGFGGGFPTPPQAPGTAPAATPTWR